MSLQGLRVTKKSDCEWYKTKLLNRGIKESDIHFDECKSADAKVKNYQIRLTCAQKFELPPELNSDKNRNLSGYEIFLEEMDGQIENIKTAQSLLQIEQNLIKKSDMRGRIIDIQNDHKLKTQVALIKLFEQAKSQSNETNYESIQSEVYKKAEKMGYHKTKDKQEAIAAYHLKPGWT